MDREPISPAVNGLMRRGLAWAPACKTAALFLLPFPLLFAALAALISGDLNRLALVGGALGSLWGAGILAFKGLAAEARYFLGERPDPASVPFKLMSAIVTMLGAGLAALAAGHAIATVLVFAALAGAGHLAFFGRDLRPQRIQVAAVEGVDRDAVMQQLKQAYSRLRAIETAARSIVVPEFRDRLARITAIGRSILGEIERDPAEATRARRFLSLYLDSAERVTVEYARTHAPMQQQPLEQNFRKLLVEMEDTFTEQHKRLVERDLVSLDVDIEVLNARLKREGLG